MDTERNYFKITGGAVKAAFDRFMTTRIAQVKARKDFCTEHGASGSYASWKEVSGLVFEEGQKPTDLTIWEHMHQNIWKPKGNTKQARELRKRMRALPLADAQIFQSEVLGVNNAFTFMIGLRVLFMSFEHIEEQLILSVPITPTPWTPPDEHCVPLKMSEYWEMKEHAKPLVAATDASS